MVEDIVSGVTSLVTGLSSRPYSRNEVRVVPHPRQHASTIRGQITTQQLYYPLL